MAKATVAYNQFRNLSFKHRNDRVRCPFCVKVPVLFKDWALHLKTAHYFEDKLACPFCYGGFRWKYGAVQKNLSVAQHRIQCLTKFLKLYLESGEEKEDVPEQEPADQEGSPPPQVTVMANGPSEVRRAHDTRPCDCLAVFVSGYKPDMRGRTRQAWLESYYDTFGDRTMFDVDQGPHHVKFLETSGLGKCIFNVFYYFSTGRYQFFHVMVRARLWSKLVATELLPPGQLHVLPYWCLCDGGHTQHDDREHRHMIWMMDNDHVHTFKKNWKRLVGTAGRNKMHKRLDTANYLMNAVFSVSNPRATCDGTRNGMEMEEDHGSDHHFWIAWQMYPHAKVAMGLLWPDGHKKHLANRLLHKAIDECFEHIESTRVQLKYLNIPERNCPIPFAKECAFLQLDSETPSGGIVYRYGSPVPLQQVPASEQLTLDASTAAEWFERQFRQGNMMWNAVDDAWYELHKNQQVCMNTCTRLKVTWTRPLQDMVSQVTNKIQRLEGENQELRAQTQDMQNLQEYSRERIKDLEKQLQECKQQLKARDKQVQECQRQFEAREKHFEACVKKLEMELNDLRERCMKQLEQSNQMLTETARQDRKLLDKVTTMQGERIKLLEGALKEVAMFHVQLYETNK